MSVSGVHVFILSGRSGSGKTTIVNEVTHVLAHSSNHIHHIHIDGDNLDFIYPKDAPDQIPNITLLNLQSLFRNYYTHRRRSCGLVLISGSAIIQLCQEIQNVIEQVCQEVDSDGNPQTTVSIHGVILHASDSTVLTRLQQREIGTDLERHLQSSLRISCLLDAEFHDTKQHPMGVLHVHTDKGSVADSASHIIEYIRLTMQGVEPSRARLEAKGLEAAVDAEDQPGAWLKGEKFDA